MKKASEYLGKSKGYLSRKIYAGKNENKDYKWKII